MVHTFCNLLLFRIIDLFAISAVFCGIFPGSGIHNLHFLSPLLNFTVFTLLNGYYANAFTLYDYNNEIIIGSSL